MPSTINAKNTSAGVVITPDASGQLELQTADTTRMTITSGGDVGVGTTSPNSAGVGRALTINGASDSILELNYGGIRGGYLFSNSTNLVLSAVNSGFLKFNTNDTERMRIASDGVITSTLSGMQVISGTSQATTSGTVKDFTGIPNWAKRITVMFSGVSTNGASNLQIQLGTSSGFETSGYLSGAANVFNAGGIQASNSTTGLILTGANASTVVVNGFVQISLFGSNIWTMSGVLGRSDVGGVYPCGGSKTTGSTLDRIRITTVNGTDAFDAGSVNIIYE